VAEQAVAEKQWKPRVNPWLIAATVALAAFMEVLDTSIANVALPHIAGNLGASTDQGTWVLTSYLVSNAIVLPAGAWASSVIGRRNFFMSCVGGSVLIALTGALVTNRTLFHEARLQNFMQPGSYGYERSLGAIAGGLQQATGNAGAAHTMAQAAIYGQMNMQAAAMGYVDVYRVLCWASVILIGFAFLLSKNRPGQGAPAGEAMH
jgi:MFS family permease